MGQTIKELNERLNTPQKYEYEIFMKIEIEEIETKEKISLATGENTMDVSGIPKAIDNMARDLTINFRKMLGMRGKKYD